MRLSSVSPLPITEAASLGNSKTERESASFQHQCRVANKVPTAIIPSAAKILPVAGVNSYLGGRRNRSQIIYSAVLERHAIQELPDLETDDSSFRIGAEVFIRCYSMSRCHALSPSGFDCREARFQPRSDQRLPRRGREVARTLSSKRCCLECEVCKMFPEYRASLVSRS